MGESVKKSITILVPVYNEGQGLRRFWTEIGKATQQLSDYEFNFLSIDDGSTDDSIAILEELADQHETVSVLELSRNFDKEVALSAGIDQLDSDAVVIMDADLQHPPSYIPEFVRKWEEGYDIVATKRVAIEN